MVSSDRQRVVLGEVIAKAWQDAQYRSSLIANPAEVLSEAGVDVGEQTVTVLEDTAEVHHLVLPRDLSQDAKSQFAAALAATLPLPDGVTVCLHQNTVSKRFLVLPQPVDEDAGLDEGLLDMVVGGIGGNGGDGGTGGIVMGGNGGNGGAGLYWAP